MKSNKNYVKLSMTVSTTNTYSTLSPCVKSSSGTKTHRTQ